VSYCPFRLASTKDANHFENSTLICVPIGGQLLDAAGPTRLVGFLGGVLTLSLVGFVMSRWACLEYQWKWKVKI
jgi:hypothetical protein